MIVCHLIEPYCKTARGKPSKYSANGAANSQYGWMTNTPPSLALIGNTPLVKLEGPSREAGCEIFGKCEFTNPGASVKDRAALYIVRDAEERGVLKPGGRYFCVTHGVEEMRRPTLSKPPLDWRVDCLKVPRHLHHKVFVCEKPGGAEEE